jgi:hypothetical protein
MIPTAKRIHEILKSGVIESKYIPTSQTETANVYMIDYHGTDSEGEYILLGYVQIGIRYSDCNAIVNGEPMEVFDITLMDKDRNIIGHQ